MNDCLNARKPEREQAPRRQHRVALRGWGARGALLALTVGAVIAQVQQPARGCECVETGLLARLGHSVTGPWGPWEVGGERTVDGGQSVWFQALDSYGNPVITSLDLDCVGGQQKFDLAHYRWDMDYEPPNDPDGDLGDWEGYSGAKAWSVNGPGDRIVRLYVYDDHDFGCTDDANHADTVKIKVKLTLETDSMEGASGEWGSCTAAGHAIVHDGLASAWAAADYTLQINGNHDTNCTHHRYLGDELTAQQVLDYLANYENQDCHLYLMGGHRYRAEWNIAGYNFSSGNKDFAVVFNFQTYPPFDNYERIAVELHENACHDVTVGAIGHCYSGYACACTEEPSAYAFCTARCIPLLKEAEGHD